MESAGEQGEPRGEVTTTTSVAPSATPDPGFGHAPFGGFVRTRLEGSGRLTLPAAYRSAFDGHARIRPQKDQHLMLWTEGAFRGIANAYGKPENKVINPRARKLFFMSTMQVTIDRQSRFVVPPDLRELVGLGEEIVLAGAIETLEIWPAARFDEVVGPELDGADLFFDVFDGLSTDPE
jgi:MraZ protein